MSAIFGFFYFVLNVTPGYSVGQSLVGIYAANRLALLTLSPFLLFAGRIRRYHLPIALMTVYLLVYVLVAWFAGWEWMIYLAYFLSFLYICLIIKAVELRAFNFLLVWDAIFWLNAIYAVFQLLVLNLGYEHLAMIHSNVPFQIEHEYVPPVFITEPFYRFTGLFVESSPYVLFLLISLLLYSSPLVDRKKSKVACLALLILSGAKIAYLYFLLVALYKAPAAARLLAAVIGVAFLYVFFFQFDFLLALTYGQIYSLQIRLNDFLEALQFYLYGGDLRSSTTGNTSLVFFAIFAAGYGVVGLLVFLLMAFWFYMELPYKGKFDFAVVFLLGMLASGSLLNPHYALLVSALVFLSVLESEHVRRVADVGTGLARFGRSGHVRQPLP